MDYLKQKKNSLIKSLKVMSLTINKSVTNWCASVQVGGATVGQAKATKKGLK